MINMFDYFNFNQLYKFASKEGFISRLRTMGARDEVISYVESLEESLCGVVVGAVVKNKDISLDQLKELVANKERVEQLKKETAKQIEEDLSVEEERIRNWIIPQVKKDKKNRALFLGNLDKINRFLSENDVDLATYDLKSLLDYIDRIENFGSASGESQDPVSQFLAREMDRLNQKLLVINNPPLVNWAKRKAVAIYGEWEKKIRRVMVERSFEQLMEESNKIREDIDHGLYRGRELPDTPLRYGEYDSLVSNIEFLDDWHKNTASDIREYSINGAIAASNQWHREMADSGEGFQYEKINRSDIVFGPEGWQNKENNGHFILELKSENDLKVEGAKMSHCVGGYGGKIKKGAARIFSLRHIDNVYQPILTIETDSSGALVRQDYGPSNQKISQKYHDMVTEWSSKNKLEDYSKLTSQDIYRIKDPNFLKEIVIKTDNPNILQSIATNRAANQAVFEAILAKTDDPSVLQSAVQNPAANQDIFEAIIAKTDDAYVLNSITQNPAANQDILAAVLAKLKAIIAKTNDRIVLQSIAQNPAANQDILAAIVAKTDNPNVLKSVAANPAANQAVLTAIIDKKDNPSVLESVARNPAANQDILAAIMAKFEEIVAKTDDLFVIQSIAGSSMANQAIFEAIMTKTDNPYVLYSIAVNPVANPAILAAIVAKSEGIVTKTDNERLHNMTKFDLLISVARNPAANQDILAAIVAKTDNPAVLSAVALNPAANQAIFTAIVAKTDNPNVLNLVRSRIEALKQNSAIASASHIDLIYKRACRFERVSLSN